VERFPVADPLQVDVDQAGRVGAGDDDHAGVAGHPLDGHRFG
jgi:hypothetical protein